MDAENVIAITTVLAVLVSSISTVIAAISIKKQVQYNKNRSRGVSGTIFQPNR